MVRTEDSVAVELEGLEGAEAEVAEAEEAVVRRERSASRRAERGVSLLYPLPHGCFSCGQLRMSSLHLHPQVRFTSMTSVFVFCSILVLPTALLRRHVLLG